MSINAYRVYPTKSDTFTFNFSHNAKLVEFYNKKLQLFLDLDFYGTGIVDIPVDILEASIESRNRLKLTRDIINRIQSDINDAKSHGGEVVSYYCY